MAYISFQKNDYFGAQEIGLQALKYLNQNDTSQYASISSNYNTLGRSTYHLKRYSEANEFYDKAIIYAKHPSDLSEYLNNKGKAYEEAGLYNQALNTYSESIKNTTRNSSSYARTLNNIALTRWLQNPKYNPLTDFFTALKIRQKTNDINGLNSSYARLSDYYLSKNVDSSIFFAKQMLLITENTKSSKDKLIALRKLSLLAEKKDAKIYLRRYLTLLDSLDIANNDAKNQFALIRFQSEEHKSNFLLAQNENIKKRNNIIQLLFVAVVLVALLVFGYLLYRKRKRQLQQEKALEVKNTELKYVKKVHDRVANKVYQVISEVENIPELDKDQILDKLDAIYEISRDISYEDISPAQEDFSLKLTAMLSAYKSAQVNIDCQGNESSLWQNVTETSKAEIFLVLRELMTNMDKHSEASVVKLQIWQEEELINIHYHDDGLGMVEEFKFNNGLKNTVSRINSICGSITFEPKNKNGLDIQISFPTF
ncbi:MAG: ATP-binding protein [Pedobacter sp.]|nr:MAG: ATP-binding protein [Pedobacter sp.]